MKKNESLSHLVALAWLCGCGARSCSSCVFSQVALRLRLLHSLLGLGATRIAGACVGNRMQVRSVAKRRPRLASPMHPSPDAPQRKRMGQVGHTPSARHGPRWLVWSALVGVSSSNQNHNESPGTTATEHRTETEQAEHACTEGGENRNVSPPPVPVCYTDWSESSLSGAAWNGLQLRSPRAPLSACGRES